MSKWETGQGFPDISLLEPLANALDISVIELLSGEDIKNLNRSSNMARAKFYVCPVCGNVIQTTGEAVVSCCGITLPPLEAESADAQHAIRRQIAEDEVLCLGRSSDDERPLYFIPRSGLGSGDTADQALSGRAC